MLVKKTKKRNCDSFESISCFRKDNFLIEYDADTGSNDNNLSNSLKLIENNER